MTKRYILFGEWSRWSYQAQVEDLGIVWQHVGLVGVGVEGNGATNETFHYPDSSERLCLATARISSLIRNGLLSNSTAPAASKTCAAFAWL